MGTCSFIGIHHYKQYLLAVKTEIPLGIWKTLVLFHHLDEVSYVLLHSHILLWKVSLFQRMGCYWILRIIFWCPQIVKIIEHISISFNVNLMVESIFNNETTQKCHVSVTSVWHVVVCGRVRDRVCSVRNMFVVWDVVCIQVMEGGFGEKTYISSLSVCTYDWVFVTESGDLMEINWLWYLYFYIPIKQLFCSYKPFQVHSPQGFSVKETVGIFPSLLFSLLWLVFF